MITALTILSIGMPILAIASYAITVKTLFCMSDIMDRKRAIHEEEERRRTWSIYDQNCKNTPVPPLSHSSCVMRSDIESLTRMGAGGIFYLQPFEKIAS